MRDSKYLDHSLFLLQFALDFVLVYGAYLFAFWLYEWAMGVAPQTFNEALTLATIPAALCVTSFSLSAVYRCQPGPVGLEQLKRLVFAYFWSAMMCLSLTFFVKADDYSRLTVTGGIVMGFFAVLAGRGLHRSIAKYLRRNLKLERRVLILGAGKVGRALARNLLSISGGPKVSGFLDDLVSEVKQVTIRIGERDHTLPVLGALSDLEAVCRQYRPQEVIVAMTRASFGLHQDLLERARHLNVSFSIVPSALDLMLTGAQAYSIGRIPLFRVGDRPEFIISPILKRVFDIVFAVVIGILSAPIWILTAIAIKLESNGPVFFVHERVGRNGEKFKLFKFRSMSTTTDPYATKSKTENGQYVTRVGRLIRRTSIDELPQLINILLGDMSLVGPRPEMPFIVDTYDDLQRLRLSVKPGLTGVWQISADRANPIHENIDYDLYYLENQSFWLDCAILIKTFTSVVRGIGAY